MRRRGGGEEERGSPLATQLLHGERGGLGDQGQPVKCQVSLGRQTLTDAHAAEKFPAVLKISCDT